MPFYDLRCSNCDKEINVMATVTEKTEKKIKCPECGSHELETVFKAAPSYIKGTSKTADCPNSHVCGSACCHAHAG